MLEEGGRFLHSEAQVLGADLCHQTLGPHPRQRQQGVASGDQHQAHAFGRMAQKFPEQLVDRLLTNGVVVIQDQDIGLVDVAQFVQQGACDDRYWRQTRSPQQARTFLAGSGKHGLDGSHKVVQKCSQITVVHVQRQPGVWTIPGLQPRAD